MAWFSLSEQPQGSAATSWAILPRWAGIALLSGMAFAAGASASVIDFETLPASQGGGTPSNDQTLSGLYTIDGVTLSFMVDEGSGFVNPVFEQVGQQTTAESGGQNFGFLNSVVNGGACPAGAVCPGIDTAAPGFESQLGNWFLRSATAGAASTLRIQYSSAAAPVTAASGEIWDIEKALSGAQNEQWRVSAFDVGGGLLGVDTSPIGSVGGSPLDGLPWMFSFSGLDDSTGGIDHILIEFVGTLPGGATPPTVPPGPPNNFFVGLAFNNFSPVSVVPEPSTLALALGGLAALLTIGARRRRKGSETGG